MKILDKISELLGEAFTACGYDKSYGKAGISNRPDLCQFQCNGAMAAAKKYGKAPFIIGDEVAEKLSGNGAFESVECVKPGFINMVMSADFIGDYVRSMAQSDKLGCDCESKNEVIFLDYGGANVAKPLHIGHLRSAIIGESVKRICNFAGYKTVADVHLGDWGLQMGLIIMELKSRKPELPYFDESYEGEYPSEAPFTLSELDEIYPSASAKSKEDEEFKSSAQQATVLLQNGHRGYTALWRHIMNVSIPDLKRNYGNLNVSFDLWKGESDAKPYIADMVQDMLDKGIAHESQGALVVDVTEEGDSKELPPCIVRKSDGAANYETTDLATLIEREREYSPKSYLYFADKRQELHYTQLFRTAKKAGIVGEDTELKFIGFGTMNGSDGKPFKTRQGGVLRLEYLIKEINDAVYAKIMENRTVDEAEARETAGIVGLAALKYGDLSNQASKDYVFDMDRFISFEGDTGPYILYTIVRIKSILKKYEAEGGQLCGCVINDPEGESETALFLELTKLAETVEGTFAEKAPHKLCKFVYDLSNAFNRFYHDTKILGEENENRKKGYIALLVLTRDVLTTCIDLLGIEAPERM
ncbi:MAG: arginine--tRNA ligase [Butyrivibrio sp.]|nr:arginine--tRNA ligase [Butyrivibrio sp.]